MEYIILLLVLLFGAFYLEKGKGALSKRWFYLEWLLIVLIFGLRYKVGGDSIHYEASYLDNPPLSKFIFYDPSVTERYAPLWRLFVSICRSISDEFLFFQIVHAIFFNSCIFYFFKKHTDEYYLAILLYSVCYIFVYNTETLRASLAIGVFLLSFDYIKNKQWFKYILSCLIAYLFHYEAVIMLVFPMFTFFEKCKIDWTIVMVTILLSYSLITIVDLYPILSDISNTNSTMKTYYEYYSYAANSVYNLNAVIYDFLVKVAPLILLLFFTKDNSSNKLYFVMLIFFQIVSIRYSVFTSRMVYFIAPVAIVYISKMSEDLPAKKNVPFICTVTFFVVTTIISHWYLFPFVYPYSSIINPVEYPEREYLLEYIMSR